MWNLDNLNPSTKFYWGDKKENEWVALRVVDDEAMKTIRASVGIKNKQKYVPNTLTKTMEAKFELENSEETIAKLTDAMICYQIENWNLKTPDGKLIPSTDENKLKLFYGSPKFSKWVNSNLEKLQKELNEIGEAEIKN